MSAKKPRRRWLVRRMLRLRYVPVWLVLVLAITYLVWPERIHNIVTVQGQFLGSGESAPPRYKIVWQQAYEVETPASSLGVDDICPQLAEDGSALWFTRRTPDGGSDIYRARVINGVVQSGEPVEQLNTEANDVGAVFRPDGNWLYFYSNRPGGYGGFDLYSSEKTEDGWSEPRNLGPQINSPAHEYSPTVSADGRRLYFASNLTLEMLERSRAIEPGQPRDEWNTTLRSDQGLQQFDLYVARRETENDAWEAAEPLEELNRADANEGDPFVGAKGAFLYFTSNRSVRDQEQRNYDVYRARIVDDDIVDVENLGSGVNTPANELEPSLSPEGFRLYFSRNQLPRAEEPAAGERYAVYCSEAVEIIEETGWGQSKLAAILGFLARNWWWLVLFLLTLALLAALIWYLREMSLHRLPVPGFVLTALLIHVLLGVGSFYVYFGQAIMMHIRQELAEILVATQIDEDLHQSHKPGPESYEKVADLKAIEAVEPSELARQVTEMPNVPVRTDNPLPSVPTRLRRSLPPDRLMAPPPVAELEAEDPELQRRRRELERLAEDRVEMEQPQAVQQKPEQQLARVDVQFDRRRPVTEIDNLPTLPRRVLDPTMQLAREEVTAQRVSEEFVETNTDQEPTSLERSARVTADPSATPQVQTEALAAPVAAGGPAQPEQVAVAVGRSQVGTAALAALPALPRRALDPTMQLAREEVTAQRVSGEVVETNTDQEPTSLERSARVTADPSATPQVQTEALGAPVAASGGPSQPEQVAVAVGRSQVGTAALAALPTLPRQSLNPAMQLAREEVTAEHGGSTEAVQIDTDQELTTLARTARVAADTSANPSATSQVQTEALGAPVAASGGPSQPEQVAVAVGRRQVGTAALAALPTLPRQSLNPAMQLAREEVTVQRGGPAEVVGINTDQQPTTLARTARAAGPSADSAAAVQVETVALGTPAVAASSGGTGLQPAQVAVAVGRRASAAPSPGSVVLNLAGLDARIGVPTAEQPGRRVEATGPTARPTSGKVTAQLARATRPAAVGATEVVATERPGAAPQAASGPATVEGIDVGIDRPEAETFHADVKTPSEFGGQYSSRQSRLVVGSLDREAVDAPPTFSHLASRIPRRAARAPTVLYAEDNIGLQAMFRLRGGESKIDLVRAFGGSDETLDAVRRGLEWLKRHQHDDGRWSLDQFYKQVPGKNYSGRGSVKSDAAATGFALLPFLGDGHTHAVGDHQSTVRKGIQWLVDHQKPDGDLATETGSNVHMYSHAIAAIPLCEAYGMSKDPALREPAQRAIDFIVKAQHKPSGGWRYTPNQDADTSVVGWQVMALKSGQMAALNVSQETLDLVPKWLASAQKGTGRYSYQRGGSATPPMTAEGLLCVEYLGADRNDPRLREGAKYLLENLPQEGKESSYYWYYGTQTMFHLQGEPWEKWNDALHDMLIETQIKKDHLSGTWDPKDQWESQAGRIYATALRLLMLEVYYRHLPLYDIYEQ